MHKAIYCYIFVVIIGKTKGKNKTFVYKEETGEMSNGKHSGALWRYNK